METAKINKLQDILSRQIAAHEELRTVLLDQQSAIRHYDSEKLNRLRERGDVLATRIADLEKLRESITGEGVKISQLAEQLGAPAGVKLSALAAVLKKLIMDIAAINRINRSAVSQMLDHFSSVYKIFSQAYCNKAYGANGQAERNPSGTFLVDAMA